MAETRSDIAAELVAWHRDARRRTLELVAGLDDRQLIGPRLAIVNPMRWEVGHVAWFQEFWVLRHARGEAPIRADGDSLYDSIKVAHDTRWGLPLPSMADTLAYAEAVLDRALARVRSREPTGATGRVVGNAGATPPQHVAKLLYGRSTRRLRGISYLRGAMTGG
jgi:gamma-glutamyl hercynylcysteine S-oxide synthase